jgi:hypothetical protein
MLHYFLDSISEVDENYDKDKQTLSTIHPLWKQEG